MDTRTSPMSLRQLAQALGVSQPFLSQIRTGKRPLPDSLKGKLEALGAYHLLITDKQPSLGGLEREKGVEPSTTCLEGPPRRASLDWLESFVSSRKGERGLTPKGEEWVRKALGGFLCTVSDPLTVTRTDVEGFLAQSSSPWVRHSNFRAIRAFYNWLEAQGRIPLSPCHKMQAPKLPKVVLGHPSLSQVEALIAAAPTTRDKAIISLFADTGMRLSELAQIALDRIDWAINTIRIMGKGRKERLVKFGRRTRELVTQHLASHSPNGNIWGVNAHGIQTMLVRLGKETGIKCNAHSFRRFFAIELRKRGVDSQTIQYLGGWESLAMVERYSRAAKQEVALAEYVPLTESLGRSTPHTARLRDSR